ncbi:MAG: DUF6261 family protein [Alistipes sp.]|jgi:hypothetical protein|nr:DUF6261 family protein [Alistipes sp.]
MKIEKITLSHLRADAHFELMVDVRGAVKEAGPETLRVKPQFDALVAAIAQEDAVLKKIARSVLTAQIAEADHVRDGVFSGMRDAVKSALNHYVPATKAAAERVWNVLRAYGNVAARPHDEETSAVYNLLIELTGGKYMADAETLGITGWLGELDRTNNAVQKLAAERYAETADRVDMTLRQARAATDAAWEVLSAVVYGFALAAPAGEQAAFDALIRRLNAIIEHYDTILAQQAGRRAADAAKEPATTIF